MAERLSSGNVALALLCNTIATGASLVAPILTLGPISCAHFPSCAVARRRQPGLAWPEVGPYLLAQLIGAFLGGCSAHAMFGELRSSPLHALRAGASRCSAKRWLPSGCSASSGRLAARASLVASPSARTSPPPTCSTASTSFANPAVTLARAASNTFGGHSASRRPSFHPRPIDRQAACATALFRWLVPSLPLAATDVVTPHRAQTSGEDPRSVSLHRELRFQSDRR